MVHSGGKKKGYIYLSHNFSIFTKMFSQSTTYPVADTGTGTTAAKSFQSCPTLCNPTEGSPRVSPVPGILQARTLEWVAISFSNAWKWKVKVKSFSRVRLLATPWTAAHQAPPSMGFSRQAYWSEVPLPSSTTPLYIVSIVEQIYMDTISSYLITISVPLLEPSLNMWISLVS